MYLSAQHKPQQFLKLGEKLTPVLLYAAFALLNVNIVLHISLISSVIHAAVSVLFHWVENLVS